MEKKNQGHLMISRWLLILTVCFTGAMADTEPLSPKTEEGRSSTQKMVKNYATSRTAGLSFDFSPTTFSKYAYSDGSLSTLSAFGVVVNLEWLPITNYGKLGVGGTTGFYMSGGQAVGTESLRLMTIPISANLSYYFDYLDDQFVIPFVRVGANMTFAGTWNEYSGARSNLSTFTGLEYFGGVQFDLNPLEPSAALSLDNTTGINNTYIALMYGMVQGLPAGAQPDLSRMEFRLGIRFEL